MLREIDKRVVTLTNSVTTTAIIDLGAGFASGKIYLPAGYVSVSLTFYTQDPNGLGWKQEYKSDGNALSLTIAASRCVPLPDQLYACSALKIVTNGDDSARPVGIVIRT